MDLTLNDHLKIPDEVLSTRVGEDTVLLNLQTGMYHSLDPVGTRFLDLVQTGGGLDAVHHAMLEEFDVSNARLETDLLKLSQDMLAKGLLVKGGG
jgi:hypothetical protein